MFTVVDVLLYSLSLFISLFIYLFFCFVLGFFQSCFVFGRNHDCLPTTCSRKCVTRPSWLYWKHEVSSMRGEKRFLKKVFLHIQSDCPPPRLLHPPKGNKTILCVRTPYILTKGGGLKTKSEALALYVCNGALGTLEVTCKELKMFLCSTSPLYFQFNLLWKEVIAKKENILPPRCDYFPFFWTIICSKCPGEGWDKL